MLKDLKTHEKEALIFQLAALFEHDETSAILATLQRIAERKAFAFARGAQIDHELALRWQDFADALASIRAELERQAIARNITDI